VINFSLEISLETFCLLDKKIISFSILCHIDL